MDLSFPNDDDDEDHDDKPDGDRRTVLKIAAGELDAKREQWERAIAHLAVPPGMAPFDTAAFTNWFLHSKGNIRLQIQAIDTIKSRLKTRCLNYAIQIERQLELQRQGQGFLEAVQNDVN